MMSQYFGPQCSFSLGINYIDVAIDQVKNKKMSSQSLFLLSFLFLLPSVYKGKKLCRFEGFVSWFMAMTENRVGFFFKGRRKPWRSWQVALLPINLPPIQFETGNLLSGFFFSQQKKNIFFPFLHILKVSLSKFVLFTTVVYLRGVDSHLVGTPHTPKLMADILRSAIKYDFQHLSLSLTIVRLTEFYIDLGLFDLARPCRDVSDCPHDLMSQQHAKPEIQSLKSVPSS